MDKASNKPRLPAWLKKRVPVDGEAGKVRSLIKELALSTVCTSAHCPNISECFARRTATFLILGERCTRDCRFCAVDHAQPLPPREEEPAAVAEAAARMELAHVVVTSVTRDDLPDGGAGHFARTIRAIRQRLPRAAVEVLVPDFRGDRAAVQVVLDERPEVFGHNIETVWRLYPLARAQADYARSLRVIRQAADSGLCTKSGLMLGLGETDEEIRQALRDLLASGCKIMTLGQYLAPSPRHAPVERFVRPEEFERWRQESLAMGFASVAAGPFVRSSYHAAETYTQTQKDFATEFTEDTEKRKR